MTRNTPALPSTVAIAGALCLLATGALGYSYHETADGDPIRWSATHLTVILDPSLSRIGDPDEVRAAIEDAFDIWLEAAALPLEVVLERGECASPSTEPDGVSCIWVAGTAPADHATADATTYIRYSAASGEISEGDIVFYEDAGPWTTDGAAGALDVLSVAAHEVGHLIGLGHSEFPDARMYPTLDAGDTWSGALSGDDIDGAEELYDGLDTGDGDDAPACSVGGAPGRTGRAASLLAALVSLV
jgi:hypothetical protein